MSIAEILGHDTIGGYSPTDLTKAINDAMDKRKPSDISGMTDLLQSIVPIGSIRLSPATQAEPGWALCDGAFISKLNFPTLNNLMSARGYPQGEEPDAFGLPLLAGPNAYLAYQIKLG